MTDHATASTFLKAEQIRAQAEHLYLLPFPSSCPRKFASLLSQACEKLKSVVIGLSKRPGTADVDRQISFISLFLVDRLAPTLRFIEGASSENTPASLVGPLEKIGKMLLPGAEFLVRRQWRYNYRVQELRQGLGEELKGLLSRHDFKDLFPDEPQKLYSISFPSFERDSALLHVNFAHEIGHPMEERYLAADPRNQEPLAELRTEIEKEDTGADVVKRAKDIGAATSYWRAAVEELISDTISTWVFGPSALFALSEVVTLSHSADEISKDLHPPWRFRLRNMLSVLEEQGFVDPASHELQGWRDNAHSSLSGVKSSVDNWLKHMSRVVEQNTDWDAIRREGIAAKCAYESVSRVTGSVRTFAAQTVADTAYTRDLFSEEVPWLLERLFCDLPPNQIERSLWDVRQVKLASILSSGWLYKLAKLHPEFDADAERYVERAFVLNRLILKALELSVVAGEFMERDGESARGAAKQE